MIKLLFLLSAFYFLLSSNAEAITYRWASTTGGAGASCAGTNITSGTTPVSNINLDPKSYQTVSQVLACAGPGDWVIFKGGGYDNIFPPLSSTGTTGDGRVKLIAAPGETVTARHLGHFSGGGFYHAFSGTSTIPGIANGVTGGTFRTDGSGLTSGYNVEVWYDSIIENMEIAFSPNSGLFNIKRSVMKNLWVHHAGNFSGTSHGIYTGTFTPLNNNNIIDGGIWENNAAYGINCYTGCEGTVIKNTLVRNNPAGGIIAADHFGLGNTQVYNNIVYNSGSDGITLSGVNMKAYNNTIWNSGAIGLRMETGTSEAKNNLMVANGCSNGIFSNGCVTICGTGGNICTNNVNTGTIGQHFVNAAAGDFRLCRGVGDPANCPGGASSAIGAGAALGSPYDVAILNPAVTGGTAVSRPQPTGGTWDAGAFESAATGPPPTLITMQITGPTINATHVATATPITISGTAAASGTTITSCTWTNSQSPGINNCTSFNQTSFTINNITLSADSVNTITVTLDDGPTGATPVTDAIAVAYSPPALIDAWGFDEGAGLTTTGVNGNVLTLNGASWTASGKYTNALSFNGTSSSLSMASNAALNKIIGGFTLSAQVYPTVSIPATFRAVAARNYNMYLYNSVAGLCGSGNPGGGFYDGANFIACDTQPIQINQFTCLAMTYDGLNVRLYTNGNLVETQSAVGLPDATAGTFQVGATMHGEYFQGVIDELRLYNRALSDSELKSDCSTAITSPPAPGTVAVKFGALGAKFGASANAIRLGPTP